MASVGDTRQALGHFGEVAAASHLLRNGYTIIARGWRCKEGEIDLVATIGNQVVFVEVRTRRGDTMGSAEESVTPTKQARLMRLAHTYLAAHNIEAESDWRIDVVAIAVDRSGRVARLEHLESAVGEF